jgi:hypothetical protein
MSAMGEMVERRRFPRVAVQGQGRYRKIPISVKGHRLKNGKIQDVSRGGFRLQSEEFLNPKSNLLLELHLPGQPTIRSLAAVAWVNSMPGSGAYDVGGVFIDPTHETRAALGRIISG